MSDFDFLRIGPANQDIEALNESTPPRSKLSPCERGVVGWGWIGGFWRCGVTVVLGRGGGGGGGGGFVWGIHGMRVGNGILKVLKVLKLVHGCASDVGNEGKGMMLDYFISSSLVMAGRPTATGGPLEASFPQS